MICSLCLVDGKTVRAYATRAINGHAVVSELNLHVDCLGVVKRSVALQDDAVEREALIRLGVDPLAKWRIRRATGPPGTRRGSPAGLGLMN